MHFLILLKVIISSQEMLLGCLWTTLVFTDQWQVQKLFPWWWDFPPSNYPSPTSHLSPPSGVQIGFLQRTGMVIQQEFCGFSKCSYYRSVSSWWIFPPHRNGHRAIKIQSKSSHTQNHSINNILLNISVYERPFPRSGAANCSQRLNPACRVCL